MARGTALRPAALAGLLVIAVVAMPGFADRLVYFPMRAHDGGTPEAIGAPFEDVWLDASDGVRVHAWFVPACAPASGVGEDSTRAAAPERARRLAVLFLHGNAGNVSHRLGKLETLRDLGVAVLMLDYRGYGASQGSPDEPGLYRDADAAYDWLIGRGLAAADVVLYGESLGGTVATELAARRPVGGLVLESTPSSILGVARHHYPFVPIKALLSARYDALSRIGRVSAPILILHSPEDEIVPFVMAEEMRAGARAPVRLVRLRGGHNDNFLVAAQAYRSALEEFLAERANASR
jgi:fermentation-respiration switch protein FrsA (DUF1100 family)